MKGASGGCATGAEDLVLGSGVLQFGIGRSEFGISVSGPVGIGLVVGTIYSVWPKLYEKRGAQGKG